MSKIEILDAGTLADFVAGESAVLILAKTTCENCARWSAELEGVLADGEAFPGVRFGKLYLDQRGLGEFKKANPWLADVHDLPFNVIYRKGERLKTFAGGGVDRLRARLERIGQ